MSENNQSHWIPLSDLMTGLMMMFMLIAIVFMLRVEQTTTLVVQELEQTKKELLQALQTEFAKNLKQWDAEILGDMTIRFKSPAAMFETGKSELTSKAKNDLTEFFPKYMKVITSDKFYSAIKEIRIEGHTSSDHSGDCSAPCTHKLQYQNLPLDIRKYLCNIDLSQDRANTTNEFIYGIEEAKQYHPQMMGKIRLVDIGSAEPVLLADGSEDKDRSKRLEFKIVTNAEDRMKNIAAVLNAK